MNSQDEDGVRVNGYVLHIEHLPPSELMPNNLRRIHWSKRAEAEKIARNEAYMIAYSARGRKAIDRAVISYYFYVSDNRVRDTEALLSACKPYVDGLLDAKVITNDDCWHLSLGEAKAIKSDHMQTDIIVEAVE